MSDIRAARAPASTEIGARMKGPGHWARVLTLLSATVVMGAGAVTVLVGQRGAGQPTPRSAGAVQVTPRGVIVRSTLGPAGDQNSAVVGETSPIVGAASAGGAGWWDVAADGAVFSFDGSSFHGSAVGALAAPIVGMAATASGGGYWLVASDGGVFTFGDATFRGSTGAIHLNRPIVGMAATASGGGYWLVASDGGVFTFGDATFRGSTGAIHLNRPIVGMAATASGGGYWLVASDGGVFTFGDATFRGSTGATSTAPISAIIATPSGKGYWTTATDAQTYSFGDAPGLPSGAGGMSAPVVAASAIPHTGLRLVASNGGSASLTPGHDAVPVAPPVSTPQPPAATTSGASSYTFLTVDSSGAPVRFNPCTPLDYVTNLTGAPAGAAALVSAAVGRISAATGLTFVDVGTTSEVPSVERAAYQPARYGGGWAPLLIAWSRPSQSDLLPGGNVIGEGGSSWVQQGAGPEVFVTGQAVIDATNTTSFPVGFGQGPSLGQLLLHELGHVIGLGHTPDRTQIMYPSLLPLGSAAYGTGDLAGLTRLGATAGCIAVPQP